LAANIGRTALNSKVEDGVAELSTPKGLQVAPHLWIPSSELRVRFTRSSGPGGQHVNKTSTRAELRFNVRTSTALSRGQKDRILAALAHRIDRQGWLHVEEQRSRSQSRNRELALEKLRRLLASGLHRRPTRIPTKPSKGAGERRLQTKRRHAEKKRLRGAIDD